MSLPRFDLLNEKQINIITADDILINLVFYPFKPLFKNVKTFSLPLFSIKDIALDKAFTIGRRALWRDYVDMFFLLKKNCITLKEILALAPKKFGYEFNGRLFLEQLVYFKDLETIKISFFEGNPSNSEIQNFLISEVKKQKKKYCK